MLLYPDKVAHVRSLAARWWPPAGFIALAVPGLLAPSHLATGALGAIVGTGVGQIIGAVIARSRAPRRLAAGGDDVTVIPLDSITSVEVGKRGRWLTPPTMVVTTSDGASYALTARLNKWSASLVGVFNDRGSRVTGTPQGIAISRRKAADGARPA
jgi:hypothetical protein